MMYSCFQTQKFRSVSVVFQSGTHHAKLYRVPCAFQSIKFYVSNSRNAVENTALAIIITDN